MLQAIRTARTLRTLRQARRAQAILTFLTLPTRRWAVKTESIPTILPPSGRRGIYTARAANTILMPADPPTALPRAARTILIRIHTTPTRRQDLSPTPTAAHPVTTRPVDWLRGREQIMTPLRVCTCRDRAVTPVTPRKPSTGRIPQRAENGSEDGATASMIRSPRRRLAYPLVVFPAILTTRAPIP